MSVQQKPPVSANTSWVPSLLNCRRFLLVSRWLRQNLLAFAQAFKDFGVVAGSPSWFDLALVGFALLADNVNEVLVILFDDAFRRYDKGSFLCVGDQLHFTGHAGHQALAGGGNLESKHRFKLARG